MKCGCGRQRPVSPIILGIQRDLNDAPALILFNCECKSTLAIPWASATRAQRKAAFLADLARDSKNEMAGWGG